MIILVEIQLLMMSGHVSQAVAMVNKFHPGLFETNQELLFRVLCHQFIETIAGYDTLPGRRGKEEKEGEEDMETNIITTQREGTCSIII